MIENSTLRQDSSSVSSTSAGVHVTGASTAVTVERDRFERFGFYGEGVRVDGGSTRTVVATNDFSGAGVIGVDVVGANITDIAGNTIGSYYGGDCGVGI